MSDKHQQQPYQTLGKHLRYLREQNMESLAEVSGAVEIDEMHLERIEEGQERPAEEILLLLISHFDMQDQEAVQLWELAGYDEAASAERRKQEDVLQDVLGGQKPILLMVGMDMRTMYTDSLQINADKAGLVLNFGQLNSKDQQQSIAKLGMSYDQAEQVIKQLQEAVWRGRHGKAPKQLPPSADSPQN